MQDQSNQSFEACVRQFRVRTNTVTFSQYTSFVPNLPKHMEHFMFLTNARSHAFFYIKVCVNILKKMAEAPRSILVLLPAEPVDITRLDRQIRETPWDCEKVHSTLFDCALEYTDEQAWTLAMAMVSSYSRADQL
jgi:hypothetical protein